MSRKDVSKVIETYAKKRGISRERAEEELRKIGFNFDPDATPLDEGGGAIPEGTPSPLTTTMDETARNLGALATIQGLNRTINQGASGMPTVQDIFAWRMMKDLMRDEDDEPRRRRGGGDVTLENIQSIIDDSNNQLRKEFSEALNRGDAESMKEENARLRQEQEEHRRREELQAIVQPVSQAVKELTETVNKIGSPQEKSEALQVAETLGTSIKEAIEALGRRQPTVEGGDALSALDRALDVVTKVEQRLRPPSTEEGLGAGDWRAVGVSVVGDVAKELVREYGKIQRSITGISETEATDRTRELPQQDLEEIKVGAHIGQQMGEGATEVNVFKVAEQLKMTPEAVLAAMERLAKKGKITMTTPASTPQPSKREETMTPTSQGVQET